MKIELHFNFLTPVTPQFIFNFENFDYLISEFSDKNDSFLPDDRFISCSSLNA
jgi:hypothetical protein